MKKIPMINYVKVIVLSFVTILVVLMLSNNYKKRIQYERANQDVMGFLSNVKYEELSNYLVENHDAFIYMASSSDVSLDNFEENLKEYILNEDLEKYFVYLDSNGYTSDMYKNLQNSFFSSDLSKQVTLSNYPNIFAVKDGKIVAILYETASDITLEDVMTFVSMHEVIE